MGHTVEIDRDVLTWAAGSVDSLPRDLGDGLILRTARRGDCGELAEFNAEMHADAGLPGSALTQWTHDLFELPHSSFQAERDVTVVRDTASGRIVSALFLIPQLHLGVLLTRGRVSDPWAAAP